MNLGTTIGYIAKTVEAVIWVAAMLGTAVLSVFNHAFSPPVMLGIQTFFGVLLAFRVWLVKNTPMLVQLLDGSSTATTATVVPVTAASTPVDVATTAALDVTAVAAQVADILKGTRPPTTP